MPVDLHYVLTVTLTIDQYRSKQFTSAPSSTRLNVTDFKGDFGNSIEANLCQFTPNKRTRRLDSPCTVSVGSNKLKNLAAEHQLATVKMPKISLEMLDTKLSYSVMLRGSHHGLR